MFGSAAAADTRATDEKAIREGEVAWNGDFKAKDADKIVARYADDATIMAPGEAAAKGKDAIRATLNGLLADKNMSLGFASNTVEVAKGGDIAYAQGTYTLTATNPKTKKPSTEKGTYVTVYKKQAGGDWKAIEDINTRERQPRRLRRKRQQPKLIAKNRHFTPIINSFCLNCPVEMITVVHAERTQGYERWRTLPKRRARALSR